MLRGKDGQMIPGFLPNGISGNFWIMLAQQKNRWAKEGNGSESLSRHTLPRTIHHYYGALHAFFNWTVKEGFLAASPVDRVRVAKAKSKVIQPYSSEQIKKMLQVCDYDYQHNAKFLGSRNKAIVLILFDTGLRLSELANIRLGSIDTERGGVKVTGKGRKDRIVRMGKVARKALWRYLIHRGDDIRQELWLSEERKPLQGSGIQSMLERLKTRAGIKEKGSVHRFRHTFALDFLRADHNPFNLQSLLGHNSLEMVRRYTATLGMEDALKVHEKASSADLLGTKNSFFELINSHAIAKG
jgi:site-specific recombinase XerD